MEGDHQAPASAPINPAPSVIPAKAGIQSSRSRSRLPATRTALIVFLIIACAFGFWKRTNSFLLDRSTIIARRPYWYPPKQSPGSSLNTIMNFSYGTSYVWIDDNRLVAIDGRVPGLPSAVLIDIPQNQEQPLPHLSDTLKGLDLSGLPILSPDRRNIFWQLLKERPGGIFTYSSIVTDINEFKQTNYSQLPLPNARLHGAGRVFAGDPVGGFNWSLTDVQGKELKSGVESLLVQDPNGVSGSNPTGRFAVGALLLGRDSNGCEVAAIWHDDGKKRSVELIGIDPERHPKKQYDRVMPTAAAEDVGYVSLHGNRLAWVIFRNYEPSRFAMWLHRWLPIVPSDHSLLIELRVGDLEGKHMRSLGSFKPPTTMPAGELDFFPQTVQWTPDGKHLSFLYQGGLYKIAVDD